MPPKPPPVVKVMPTIKEKDERKRPDAALIDEWDEIKVGGKEYGVNKMNDVIDEFGEYVGHYDRSANKIDRKAKRPWYMENGDTITLMPEDAFKYLPAEKHELPPPKKTAPAKPPKKTEIGEAPDLEQVNDFDEIILDGKSRGVNPFGDVIDEDGNYIGHFDRRTKKFNPKAKEPFYFQLWRQTYGFLEEENAKHRLPPLPDLSDEEDEEDKYRLPPIGYKLPPLEPTSDSEDEEEFPPMKEVGDFDEVIIDGKGYGVNKFGDTIDEDATYIGHYTHSSGKLDRKAKRPAYWSKWLKS